MNTLRRHSWSKSLDQQKNYRFAFCTLGSKESSKSSLQKQEMEAGQETKAKIWPNIWIPCHFLSVPPPDGKEASCVWRWLDCWDKQGVAQRVIAAEVRRNINIFYININILYFQYLQRTQVEQKKSTGRIKNCSSTEPEDPMGCPSR